MELYFCNGVSGALISGFGGAIRMAIESVFRILKQAIAPGSGPSYGFRGGENNNTGNRMVGLWSAAYTCTLLLRIYHESIVDQERICVYGGLIDLRIIMQFAYLTYDRRHNTVCEASLPCYPNTLSLHSVISFLFLISAIISFPCDQRQQVASANHADQLFVYQTSLQRIESGTFSLLHPICYTFGKLIYFLERHLYIQSLSHHLSQYFSLIFTLNWHIQIQHNLPRITHTPGR